MRRIVLFMLTFVLAFASTIEAQQKQASISFNKEAHNFGEIKEDDGKVVYQFSFKNTGQNPLVITQVKASCGCTSPEWTKKPIMAGKEGYVKVTFDPKNRPGPFNKTIMVNTNGDPSVKVLRVTGEVIPRKKTVEDIYPRKIGTIRLKSNHLAFVKVYSTEVKRDSMPIVNVSDDIVKIDFMHVPAYLKLRTNPATPKPGEEGYIVGQYDGTARNDWGFLIDRVRMSINGQQPSGNLLTISAKLEEDFSHLTAEEKANAPKIEFEDVSHNFGDVEPGSKVEHEYHFTNEGKSDLIIRKIRPTCGCTTVAPEKEVIKPGESSSFKAILSTGTRSGYLRKSIYVITNDPKNSNVRLVMTGKVK